MPILVLAHDDVRKLLPLNECVTVMREALLSLAAGRVHQPLRMVVRPPEAAGLMALMPSFLGGAAPRFGLKAVCVFHGNPALGKDAHQGSVLLFDGATGEPMALANGSAVTELRTAAVTAVATDALARPDASALAVIGAGVQARAHIAAIAEVRELSRVRVASRTPAHAQRLADEVRPAHPFPVEACQSTMDAVAGADIVVTVTTSADPVLRYEWLAPGTHVNAVGSSIPTSREMDTATMAAASLFVDRRESTVNESGDYLFAAREGAIGPEHIRAEVGEVLAGAAAGRTSADEITLFKSLGLAVEDLAAVSYLYAKAQKLGVGTWVDL
jgi:ornithine cyclodeaminase